MTPKNLPPPHPRGPAAPQLPDPRLEKKRAEQALREAMWAQIVWKRRQGYFCGICWGKIRAGQS